MSRNESASYVRRLAIEGRNLNGRWNPEQRADGWKKLQQAKRIVRKLGLMKGLTEL